MIIITYCWNNMEFDLNFILIFHFCGCKSQEALFTEMIRWNGRSVMVMSPGDLNTCQAKYMFKITCYFIIKKVFSCSVC